MSNTNGSMQIVDDVLESSLGLAETKFKEVIEFEKEYKKGSRNVFFIDKSSDAFFQPEIIEADVIKSSVIFSSNFPTLSSSFNVLTPQSKRLDFISDADLNLFITSEYGASSPIFPFLDTTTTDYTTPLYVMVGYIPFSRLQNVGNVYDTYDLNLFPQDILLYDYIGDFRWSKVDGAFFPTFFKRYVLKNFIESRVDFDFSTNNDKITRQQYVDIVETGEVFIWTNVFFNPADIPAPFADNYAALEYYGLYGLPGSIELNRYGLLSTT